MRFFACVVGAKSASWRSGVSDAIRPMLLRAFLPRIALVTNSPTFQIAHISNSPILQFTHVGGLIAISPYMCVIKTFANIHVNTCKYTCKYTEKHHGHGVSMFAHVVGAICKSPLCCCVRFFLESLTLQICPCYKFTHIANRPCFQLLPCGRADWN